MPRLTKIGLVQTSCGDDVADNVNRTIEGIREAAGRGARLVCLQELFASRYFCQVEDPDFFELAEALGGPSQETLRAVAKELAVSLVVPFFERRAAGLYHNSLVVLGPDGQRLGHYRKMHIPDDPQFLEKFYFTPGDLGFMSIPCPPVADSAGVDLGTLICWDQWYPEAARLTALRGAEVLCYPTAIGWIPSEKAAEGDAQLGAWQAVMRGHAVANGCFVVAVNRVGFEPQKNAAGERPRGTQGAPEGPASEGIEFWGHSFVVDPQGVILAEAGTEEEVLVVECDLARQEQVRRWWPFLRDRRVDAFGDLTRRYIDRDPE